LDKPNKEVIWENADLLFFILVGLENRGVDLQEVLEELKRRRK
jgi:phosphoribosyl-ATP pyrophosphohydrolase